MYRHLNVYCTGRVIFNMQPKESFSVMFGQFSLVLYQNYQLVYLTGFIFLMPKRLYHMIRSFSLISY